MKGKIASWILLSSLAWFAGGCGPSLLALILPAPSETIEAEFKGLTGKRVAIVVFTSQAVRYDYPYVALNLSSVMGAELKRQIEEVSIVPPLRIVQYQEENVHWDSMDRVQLAKVLQADALMLVVLEEYSTYVPGSTNLFRGLISGQVSIYDTDPDKSDPLVWKGDHFRVAYPENAPTGEVGTDDRKIRYRTQQKFADVVIKKFYEYEITESI